MSRRLLLAGLLALVLPAPAQGQGSCNVNFRASCVVGGSAAFGMGIAIPAVVKLSLPGSSIALLAPTGDQFAAGFGTAFSVPLSIQANTTWSVSLSAGTGLWTGTGPQARADKPAGDLQWGNAANGPFTDLSTLPTGVQVGGATAGTSIPLFLRTRYAWTLDTPGAYSLPLVLTITAP